MLENLTPGPWFALPWHAKVYRWVRYQPVFKVRMVAGWLRYFVLWHLRYKRYPPTEDCTCCRRDPTDEAGIYINPPQAWALTVLQDDRRLGRYWQWHPPEKEAE